MLVKCFQPCTHKSMETWILILQLSKSLTSPMFVVFVLILLAECLLESNFLILLLYMWQVWNTIDSKNFSLRNYLPLIRSGSVTQMHDLCSSCENRVSLCTELIPIKLIEFLFMFSNGCISCNVAFFSFIDYRPILLA